MGIQVLPLGDQAILVQFEQRIDPNVHRQVVQLADQIVDLGLNGVQFVSPAYCSITIGYNPKELTYEALRQKVKLCSKQSSGVDKGPIRIVSLPVCYDDRFGIDLEEVSMVTGLTTKEIIQLHTTESYRVYMLGFLPGFPYLGILPEKLRLPRKQNPKLRIPEGSVAIAGRQTGIYPSESPGGWHVLGRTPIPLLQLDDGFGFTLKTGDQVTFRSIDINEYQGITDKLKANTFNWEILYE